MSDNNDILNTLPNSLEYIECLFSTISKLNNKNCINKI